MKNTDSPGEDTNQIGNKARNAVKRIHLISSGVVRVLSIPHGKTGPPPGQSTPYFHETVTWVS